MQPIQVHCPRCGHESSGPFGHSCQGTGCGFTIDDLSGQSTQQWIAKKDQEHLELLTTGSVSLFGKEYNTSFDYNGVAKLTDLVRFAITYGSRTTVSACRNTKTTSLILAFVPEIIGSGLSIYHSGLLPCSGLVLMSAGSYGHGHSYPVLQTYVTSEFGSLKDVCKACGKAQTDFGQPFCHKCYCDHQINWMNTI
jgi:hypothetical protein